MLAFDIKLLLLSERELENKYQGSVPAITKIGYGIPSDGHFATIPNMTEKTTIDKKGLIKLHDTPITVCLYLTSISLQARK